jgi:TolA-binding protein
MPCCGERSRLSIGVGEIEYLPMKKICLVWLLTSVWIPANAGSLVELNYTEAVVAYQKNQFAESLRLIETVLKEAPEDLKALELKGLVLKDQGQSESSLAVFSLLRALSAKLKLPATQAATYDFQAGVLLVEMKQPEQAKPLLLSSIKADFNTTPARYFLGVIAMGEEKYKEAENYFRAVARGNSPMLRASAYYYLGVIAKRDDSDKEAAIYWQEARKVAQAMLATPEISAASNSTARALIARIDSTTKDPSEITSQSNFFANIAAVTSYDSNVLLNAIVNIGASGNPTLMETIRYGIGYDLPLGDHSLTTALRGSINYNFNPAARAGQFFVNDATLAYTFNSKRAFSYGLRTGATYIFRNDTSQSTEGALKPQSLGIPIAPFVRRNWTQWRWTAEVSVTPQQFFTDVGLDASLAKTGFEWHLRNQIQFLSNSRFFNPSLDLDLLVLKTNGTEYRNEGLVIGLNNAFIFSNAAVLTVRASAGYQEYRDRPTGGRYDVPLSLGGQFDYQAWKNLHLVAELNYMNNLSNVTDIYRYVRLVGGVGLDYRF